MQRTVDKYAVHRRSMKQKNPPFELDLRDVIKLNVKALQFFGHFSPNFEKMSSKILYYTYACLFIGFVLVLYMISEIINMIIVFGDIEQMTEASFLLLTHFVHAMKLYIFMVRRSDVRRLIISINREEFKPQNQEQYNMLRKDIRMSRLQTKIFLFMCCMGCALWGIFPLLDERESDGSVRLPLSGWFPFDTKRSPVFECVYVYLPMCAMLTGLPNISMDTFLTGIIMVISGQLRVLNNSFEILKLKCENEVRISEEAQLEVRKSLIRNILHHKNILQFADDMTGLFTTPIMVQFVVSVIIICLTMFQMSLVPVKSLQFLAMTFYQGCIVMEIFLWCYYGNEVILQSTKLTQSAYMCQWIDCSKNFREDLLYFMTRSQVPLRLYAGGYFILSLDTFKAIVKSSWSYFAVLRTVHSEDA